MTDTFRFETKAIHEGQAPDLQTGAVIPPIYQTSTYYQSAPGVHKGYEYSRTRNPTRTALEECLSALEGGKYGAAFASGMGAITTILSLLRPNDHVIVSDDIYGGTYRLFDKVFKHFGLIFDYLDLTDSSRLASLIRPTTKMIWLETPSNPLLKIIDIAAVADIAQAHGILLAVDNTFLSPFFQNPLQLGADMVVHSTTKYINGHSDVVGGAVIVKDSALYERLSFAQNALGAVPGPLDCWLTLRGIKTLALRMQAHHKNALVIAQALTEHRRVKKVIYPGLPSHPQYDLAQKQMRGCGGIISFELAADGQEAMAFLSRLKLILLGESLGGVESLVEHPASMSHASLEKDQRQRLGISDSLIRLSVGIEHVDDLLFDLHQALDF